MTVGSSSLAVIQTMCSENNVTIASLQAHDASSSPDAATTDHAAATSTTTAAAATTTTTTVASSSPTSEAANPHHQVAIDDTTTTAETTHDSTTDETALTSVHVDRTATSVTSLSSARAHDAREGGNGGGGGDDEDDEYALQRVSSVTSGRMSESLKVVTFEDPDINGFERLLKIPTNSGSVMSVEECSKIVYQLSKELAILHALSGGIGCETDSSRLREELRMSRHRACTLAEKDATALIPLLRSKNTLKKDEVTEVDRLYRIYSGCLEYLLYLMLKIRSLVTIFPTDIDPCYLIQTGITDPVGFVPHKCLSSSYKDGAGPAGEGTSLRKTGNQSADDLTNLVGDIKAMKQLLYVVTSASDVQPWDVDDDHAEKQKQGKMPGQSSNRRESRGLSFNDSTNRRQRLMVALAVIITLLVIIAVAVTIALLAMS